MDHINLFQTNAEFTSAYTNDYVEPWVSFTMENSGMSYNKKAQPEEPDYFTIVSLGDGVVSMENWDNSDIEIEYRINDGEWSAVTVGGNSPSEINVSNGDEVQFRGESRNYGGWGQGSGFYFADSNSTTVPVNLKGNIMSLIYGDDFAGEVEFDEGDDMILAHLFQYSTVVDASELILPATTLCDRCYLSMFSDCENLVSAPVLPASTLVYGCYSGMFERCGSLSSVTCLATDISADYCTTGWVTDVSSTGTFVKAASMTDWPTGINGIPENWTVQDAS